MSLYKSGRDFYDRIMVRARSGYSEEERTAMWCYLEMLREKEKSRDFLNKKQVFENGDYSRPK